MIVPYIRGMKYRVITCTLTSNIVLCTVLPPTLPEFTCSKHVTLLHPWSRNQPPVVVSICGDDKVMPSFS